MVENFNMIYDLVCVIQSVDLRVRIFLRSVPDLRVFYALQVYLYNQQL